MNAGLGIYPSENIYLQMIVVLVMLRETPRDK